MDSKKNSHEKFILTNINVLILGTNSNVLQVGTMVMTNQKTKHKCSLSFRSSANKGWLSNSATAAEDMHTVEGYITDPGGKKVKFLYGKWTGKFWGLNFKTIFAKQYSGTPIYTF